MVILQSSLLIFQVTAWCNCL